MNLGEIGNQARSSNSPSAPRVLKERHRSPLIYAHYIIDSDNLQAVQSQAPKSSHTLSTSPNNFFAIRITTNIGRQTHHTESINTLSSSVTLQKAINTNAIDSHHYTLSDINKRTKHTSWDYNVHTTILRNIQRYNYSQWRQHYRIIEDTSATEGTFVGSATTDTGDS